MRAPRLLPVLREAAAMARQTRYLSYDLTPRLQLGTGPVVVLLHGLYASAGVRRPLRRKLESDLDATISSFSYPPGPGIVELGRRLVKLVSAIEGERPIHLVGHSLGGLVLRHYASSSECDERVVQTISLAAPFLGSRRNYLVPGKAGQDIARDSQLLVQLRSASKQNQRIPHLALLAEDDEMIEKGAYPEFGRHVLVPRVGHNGILFDENVLSLIVETIRSADGARLSSVSS